MQGKGTNRIRAVAMTAALTAGLTLTGAASAGVVLYDTTWMAADNSYNAAVLSQIGAQTGNPNALHDSQAADDFSLAGTYSINTVTGNFLSTSGFGGEGVLVEFFSNNGGAPSSAPVAQFFATIGNGLSVSSFDNHIGSFVGITFTVDLASAGIVLDEGTWWMSMVAVHETLPSQRYLWARTNAYQEGNEVHVRDGGLAHGNGLSGVWGINDWTAIGNIGINQPGDLSMSIEGTPVPVPGALAAMTIAGLFRNRRRRRHA